MKIQGLPISDDQCIGDSLPIINSALLALETFATIADSKISSLSGKDIHIEGQIGSIKSGIDQTRTQKIPNVFGGYFTHPSGLKITWGSFTVTNNISGSVVFPIPFQEEAIVIPTAFKTDTTFFVSNVTKEQAWFTVNGSKPITGRGNYIAIGK